MKPCQHKLAVYYQRLEVCLNFQTMFRLTKTMNHSPIRKTFELGIEISSAQLERAINHPHFEMW